MVNRYSFGLLKHMKSKLLKRKPKCQLYRTIILPAVLYGPESCLYLGDLK